MPLSRTSRAPRPPADVVASLGLARGERVLAAALSGDVWLLGTRLALYVVGPDARRRLPWDGVDLARWDVESRVLEVAEVGEWDQERPVHRFALEDPTRLLELVRERVTATVLLQRRVVVTDRRGFTLHARRSPDDGAVAWFVDYDDGVDPDDALVATAVELALAEARAEVAPAVG